MAEKLKNAVFGNVGSMACFRVGVEDAAFMAKQYEPVFSETDLINIENFNAYVKLLINGLPSVPFNIATYPAGPIDPATAAAVKESSRSKYGREKNLVEQEILEKNKIQ